MAKAYKTNSEQINAISRRQQAESAQTAADVQAIRYNGSMDQRPIQAQMYQDAYASIERQKMDNWVNLGVDLTKLAIDTAGNVYNILEQDQTTKANLANQTAMEEGKRLLTASMYDGSSYWGTGDDGKAQFIVSPEVQAWADSYREKISAAKGFDSVKQNQLAAFEANYQNLLTEGMTSSIKQSYQDLNTNFSQILDGNFKDDVASYVASNGNLDVWNETAPIQGVASIATRTDWSDDLRSAKTNEYMQKVMAQGNVEIASKIALSEGNKAAWDWIYSPERSYMTEQERQDAYSIAAKANSLRAGSVAQEASDFMEDALVGPDSRLSASQVYAELEARYQDESPEVRQKAIDSAKAKQKEIVSIAGNNRFNSDREEGLSALRETYDNLLAGEFDGNYVNIEDTKDTLIRTYYTEIAAQEKALASATSTSVSAIRTANTNLLKDYENAQKNVQSQFDSGMITGKQAVLQFSSNAELFASQIQGDPMDMLVWCGQMQRSCDAFIDGLVDRYIPEKYSGIAEDAFGALKASLGLNKTDLKMTDEEKQSLMDYETYWYGYVADWIYENGATASVEEFKGFCQELGTSLALGASGKAWANVFTGEAIRSEKDATTILKDFNTLNNKVWMEGSSRYFLYDDNSQTDKVKAHDPKSLANPRFVFASEGVEATFNDMAREVATQVGYYTGIPSNEILATAVPGRDDNGNLILSPIVQADGELYRIRNNYIEKLEVNGGKGIWTNTGKQTATTEAKMWEDQTPSGERTPVPNDPSSIYTDYGSGSSGASGGIGSKFEGIDFSVNNYGQLGVLEEKKVVNIINSASSDEEVDEIMKWLKDRLGERGFGSMESFNQVAEWRKRDVLSKPARKPQEEGTLVSAPDILF